MAKSQPKIALSVSRDIPFNKLVLSQSNVRRVKAGVGIEELAEDIARRTLLQSLTVRPVLDESGAETGMYEVPAGGRRYRALELLVKQKRLARTAPVPCIVRTGGIAEEDSLAENVQRAPLHPLDQFRAFLALREKGQSEEEIAAAFFVSVAVVRQRLRLAAVSPKLLEVYAEDGMTLEQLMAFTVNPDHARQTQVWEALQHSPIRQPYQIRRLLTENAVRASDKRAQFVGLAEYEAAGGIVLRDLFEADDGGWLQDPALLDRLVAEKLEREAEAVRAEGWKWVEVAPEFPYGHTYGLRRLSGSEVPLTKKETKAREALKAELDKIEETYAEAEEIPEEVDARLGEIETALAAFDERPVVYDPAEVARAGAFVSIDGSGSLRIERGYVRPEDEAPVAPAEEEGEHESGDDNGAPGTFGNGAKGPLGPSAHPEDPAAEADEDEGVVRPLSDRLMTELTAHRTLALREAVANDPDTAFLAMLHALCLKLFYRFGLDSCLEVEAKSVLFGAQIEGLGGHAVRDGDRRAPRRLGGPAAEGSRRPLGCPHRSRRRQPPGAVRPLRRPHRQRDVPALRPAAEGHRPRRPRGRGRAARHGGGRLAPDRGGLSRARHQGPDPRSGARGQGRAGRPADRGPQEGRHGTRGRAAAGGQRLAAGAAAAAGRQRFPAGIDRRGRLRGPARLPRR